MENFNFYNPTRIHFGAGRIAEIGEIAAKYGKKCLLVTTTNTEDVMRPLFDRVKQILRDSGVDVIHFDGVVPNPSVAAIEECIQIVRDNKTEVVVALGGGSSIDTAKAVSVFWQKDNIDWASYYDTFNSPFAEYPHISEPTLPLITIPTTAGTGSELTQDMVLSSTTIDEKINVFHQDAFSKETIIDPELTVSMPKRLTAITGFDAFAHSFESYMRKEASIYTKTIGMVSMKNVIYALPKLMEDPTNMALREMMSQAEMFSGISLANAAATIPHPLSEIIGGINPKIPHGQALACIYPGFLRFQITKTPRKCAEIARLFDPSLSLKDDLFAAAKLPGLVEDFIKVIGLNKKLKELGCTDEQCEKMLQNPILGFLPFGTKEELSSIMRSAF